MEVLADLETLPTEDGNTLKNQIDSFLTALGYDTANVNAVDTGVLFDLLHYNITPIYRCKVALGYDTASINAVDTDVLFDLLHWNIFSIYRCQVALGYDTASVNPVDTGVLFDLLHWNISPI